MNNYYTSWCAQVSWILLSVIDLMVHLICVFVFAAWELVRPNKDTMTSIVTITWMLSITFEINVLSMYALFHWVLTLLIDCRKKFPLTETALFLTLDFLLMIFLLDCLISEYGFPYNAANRCRHTIIQLVPKYVFLPTALNSPNLRQCASVSKKLCDTDISVKNKIIDELHNTWYNTLWSVI